MMNKLLTFAFVPLLASLAFRYFYFGEYWYDYDVRFRWELYAHSSSLALALLSFWHIVLRSRCPQCGATKPEVLEVAEVDRFVGLKRVRERDGDRPRVIRHVSTTFVKNRITRRCIACQHTWAVIQKDELR